MIKPSIVQVLFDSKLSDARKSTAVFEGFRDALSSTCHKSSVMMDMVRSRKQSSNDLSKLYIKV